MKHFIASKDDQVDIFNYLITNNVKVHPFKIKKKSRPIELKKIKGTLLTRKRQSKNHIKESNKLMKKYKRFLKKGFGIGFADFVKTDLKVVSVKKSVRKKLENRYFKYLLDSKYNSRFKETFYLIELYKSLLSDFKETFKSLKLLKTNYRFIKKEINKKEYLKTGKITIIHVNSSYIKSIEQILKEKLIFFRRNKDYFIIFSFYEANDLVDNLKSARAIKSFVSYEDLSSYSELEKDYFKLYRSVFEHYKKLELINAKSKEFLNFSEKSLNAVNSFKNIYETQLLLSFSTKKRCPELIKRNNVISSNLASAKKIREFKESLRSYLERKEDVLFEELSEKKNELRQEYLLKKEELILDLENKFNSNNLSTKSKAEISFEKFKYGFEDYLLSSRKFSEIFSRIVKKILIKHPEANFKANPEVVHFFNEILLSNNIVLSIFLDYDEKGLTCYEGSKVLFSFDFEKVDEILEELYRRYKQTL